MALEGQEVKESIDIIWEAKDFLKPKALKEAIYIACETRVRC